jgi:DNA-binding transcriptional ArsR family regulator
MATENSAEILRRLMNIDYKTDSMQDSLAWLVSANAGPLKAELIKAFGNNKRRVQVYLALDGLRNVQQLADALRMKRPNVSRELLWLKKKRLIDFRESGPEGNIYDKKFFDAIVGLSEALEEKFHLDGRGPNTKGRKR